MLTMVLRNSLSVTTEVLTAWLQGLLSQQRRCIRELLCCFCSPIIRQSGRPIETLPGFDGTFYPPGMESVPRRYAIVRANRYMIDHVDYLIAYAWHPASNAKELTAYALRKGVVVTNLGEIRESKEK